MGSLATSRMSGWRTALKLGRVSNLPTVWSNVIAATALAGGAPLRVQAAVAAAMSLLYVGGMYLNDAFDSEHDARARPERPIPAGEITVAAVFGAGFALLAAGVILLAGIGLVAGAAGVALAGAIVLYDRFHKGNPIAPLLMGLCRALVYATAGLAAAGMLAQPVLLGALALLAYVAGLTYVARFEAFDAWARRTVLAEPSAPASNAFRATLFAPLRGDDAVLDAWVVREGTSQRTWRMHEGHASESLVHVRAPRLGDVRAALATRTARDTTVNVVIIEREKDETASTRIVVAVVCIVSPQ